MGKCFNRLFFFGLVFYLNFNLQAGNIIKGEVDVYTTSPLNISQEKDTTYLNKFNLINQLYESEDYTEALRLALKLSIEANGKNSEIEYQNNFLIGSIFTKRNDYEKALLYFKRALSNLSTSTSLKDLNLSIPNRTKSIANTLLRIGGEYYNLNKKDSAIIYFQKVIDLPSVEEFLEIKAKAYSNLSGTYLGKNNFELAKEYVLKSIAIHEKRNNNLDESAALNNLASIYLVEKNYTKAKEIYSKAIALIANDQSIHAIKNKEDLYYNLAYVMYMQKDYKAYEYLDKSFVFKDTLTNREIRRIVKGVYAEYQEQYKIDMLKNQVALKKAEERKTNYYLGALMLLILIVFGVIIYNYKLRQKNLKLNFEQNKLAQQSQIERLKSETQIRILNATLDGKESERKQIAETLHDSVSTLLSSASLHLQASKSKFNGTTPLEIEKSQTIISEASQKIRDLSHTLVSSVLLKFGLKYSINEMGQKYSNSQIEIETSTKNINRYHQSFEIKVNNIIQEFVNNILKHSKATYALVQVEEKNKQLFIHIEDNGCGFDKDGVVKKDGLGINQIEARIQMMKGTLEIDSIKNKGTKIRICLPIVEKEETILL